MRIVFTRDMGATDVRDEIQTNAREGFLEAFGTFLREGPNWAVSQWFDENEEPVVAVEEPEQLVYMEPTPARVTQIPTTALLLGGLAAAGVIIYLVARR